MCQHGPVRPSKSKSRIRSLVAILVLPPGLMSAALPLAAHAADCPDAQVVFARGTDEAPGPGGVGTAFINSLRTAISPKTLDVYAVDYPATTDFPTAVDGIRDARRQIVTTAAACPRTKMVLGGFSQGAAVAGFVTAGTIPDGISAAEVPAPMPPDVADHVAAVALFGKPSPRFMRAIGSLGHRRPGLPAQDHRSVRTQRPRVRRARVELRCPQQLRGQRIGHTGCQLRGESTAGRVGGRRTGGTRAMVIDDGAGRRSGRPRSRACRDSADHRGAGPHAGKRAVAPRPGADRTGHSATTVAVSGTARPAPHPPVGKQRPGEPHHNRDT